MNEQVTGWLPKDEYPSQRAKFLKDHLGKNVEFFRSNPEYFGEWNDKQAKVAARLMVSFGFGLWMVYRKFGFKHTNFNMVFDSGERNDLALTGYAPKTNVFLWKISGFKEVVDYQIEKETILLGVRKGGSMRKIPTYKLFELVGVEEAAHFLLYQEKGDMGTQAVHTGSRYDYFTSEVERRALLWKISYARRYIPDCRPSLSRILEIANRIRVQDAKSSNIA